MQPCVRACPCPCPCPCLCPCARVPVRVCVGSIISMMPWHPARTGRWRPQMVIAPGPFTVEISESIAHSGAPFRISLSAEGDDKSSCVLLDHIPSNPESLPTRSNPATYQRYFVTVQIPDVDCKRCSLQLANPMTDKIARGSSCPYPSDLTGIQALARPSCDSVYHSCSDITITGTQPRAQLVCPTTSPAGWPHAAMTKNTYTQLSATWSKTGFLVAPFPETFAQDCGVCSRSKTPCPGQGQGGGGAAVTTAPAITTPPTTAIPGGACSDHADCGASQFCAIECFAQPCGDTGTPVEVGESGSPGFCQRCAQCLFGSDSSVTGACDHCGIAAPPFISPPSIVSGELPVGPRQTIPAAVNPAIGVATLAVTLEYTADERPPGTKPTAARARYVPGADWG